MDDKRKQLLVICGPTASGKTKLAVSVAKAIDGEIISADSMQIYNQLNIGTAKPSENEMQGVPHHLIDVVSPSERFSVADFIKGATEKIAEITAKGKAPIVCGGTGQYISGLIDGLSFVGEKTDTTLRERLWQREKEQGIQALYAELCSIDNEYASTLHINNKGRILRALELYYQTGKTMTQQMADSLPTHRPFNELVIGINFNERSALYSKIDARVDLMLKNGLIDEAKLVYTNKAAYITAAQAIGYKELFAFIEGEESLQTCTDKLKQASRNYAKRQLTWFKRINGIVWLDAQSDTLLQQVLELWEKKNERTR